MSYSPLPLLQEPPAPYWEPFRKDIVYEVALRTPAAALWLRQLQGIHRLVQALFQGELLGQYKLLDFVIWPETLFVRVSLKEPFSLSDLLKFLKDRTVPPGEPSSAYWDDDLQWIRLIPAGRLEESTRLFLEKAEGLRKELKHSAGLSPNLFFFYRDPKLSKKIF